MLRLGISITNLSIRSPLQTLARMSMIKKDDDEEDEEEEKDSPAVKIMTILFKYAQKFLEKQEKEQITVGVIGFTNVGKSSLIN